MIKAVQPSEAAFILPKTLNKISLNTLQDKLPKHNSENIQITILFSLHKCYLSMHYILDIWQDYKFFELEWSLRISWFTFFILFMKNLK